MYICPKCNKVYKRNLPPFCKCGKIIRTSPSDNNYFKKVCPVCNSKDIHLNHADNDYRCIKCGQEFEGKPIQKS